MIDVFVGLPGATAHEVERRVISPLEKAIYEIDNVDFVYSITQPSGGMIIVRFLVGTDPDQAVVRVHSKVAELAAQLPPDAIPPVIAPRGIDDVPVVAYTLWSEESTPLELRQVAMELKTELTRHPRVAQVTVIGGQRRAVQIRFDRERLASHHVSPSAGVPGPIGSELATSGRIVRQRRYRDRGGDRQLLSLGRRGGRRGRRGLRRPAGLSPRCGDVVDGPDEAADYVWIMAGAAGAEKASAHGLDVPAVTVAVAKKPGTNAVELVTDLDERVAKLRGPVIPSNMEVTKTRDYGFTADEKSSELMKHLWIATLAVVVLMALALGRREAVVVMVAVPATLALTLAASYMFGYTLNRVTLFALIFAIGILVDDAIVVVENIHRHYTLGWTNPRQATSTPPTRWATRRSWPPSRSSRLCCPWRSCPGSWARTCDPFPSTPRRPCSSR